MALPRPARRCALAAAFALVVTLAGASPALAGGSCLAPVRDRYEAGEVATLVGYVGRGQLGWAEDGPFLAYLRAGDLTPVANPGFTDQGVPVGTLELEPVDVAGTPRLRVSLSFRLPDALPPGSYGILYCNDPCTNGLGDLIGGHLVVGTDSLVPIPREWPLDEPEIENLEPEALVVGPGFEATAAQVRSGTVPVPALPVAAPVPVAALEPRPPVTTIAPSVATIAAPPATAASPPGSLAARRPSPANEDGWLVLFGSALAAVCTASVLLALRRGPPGAKSQTTEARELEPLGR